MDPSTGIESFIVATIPVAFVLVFLILLISIIIRVLGVFGGSGNDDDDDLILIPRRAGGRTALTIGLVIFLAGPIHLGVYGAYDYFVIQPEFKREVHGHVVNAYYANTPDLMIRELQESRSGMEHLNLDPSMYSTLVPWKKTPDNRMDYQYGLIDSVISRAEAVKEDRDRQMKQGGSDQLGDVYEQKMDNLRGFLKEEGWVDDIAAKAFVIKHHPYVAWWEAWGGWTIIPWLITAGPLITIPLVRAHKGLDEVKDSKGKKPSRRGA